MPFVCAAGANLPCCLFLTAYSRLCTAGRMPERRTGVARASRAEIVAYAATLRARGGLDPLLSITPAGGCSRMPATANKFVHILWKNLICDNVAAVGFCAWPRGRGCCRCEACAHCFHEGDAPAGCQIGRAEVVAQASFSCRHAAIHLLAPYGVAANPLPVAMATGWQSESVTYFCARSAP